VDDEMNKLIKSFPLLLLTTLLLVLIYAKPTNASAIMLDVVADAQVLSLAPDTNYGSYENMGAAWITIPAASSSWSFLKFDISSLTERPTYVTLYVYATSMMSGSGVIIESVTDDTWVENVITWNNKPAEGASLQNKYMATGWNTFDVASFVKAEYDAENTDVSFLLKAGHEDMATTFSTKENPNGLKPYLYVSSEVPTEGEGGSEGGSYTDIVFSPEIMLGLMIVLGLGAIGFAIGGSREPMPALFLMIVGCALDYYGGLFPFWIFALSLVSLSLMSAWRFAAIFNR
jgi:hypothetical protein